MYSVPRFMESGIAGTLLSALIPLLPALIIILPQVGEKPFLWAYFISAAVLCVFNAFIWSLRKYSGNWLEIVSPRRSELPWKDIFAAAFFLPVKTQSRVLEEFLIGEDEDISPLPKSQLVIHMKRGMKDNARGKVTHTLRKSWGKLELIQTVNFFDKD